ncbi:SDR family NAD(P)-dependent oxidoreductase [Rhodospirillum rubrum]|uniref:3-oxoacyl-(Acyl-carrier-protein) reductase n=1 Tax=Rhodospirillum rubrum (strain ATCC 11170 / ATH 1.1.1 / DSM 467 / LMG 4362 / NCIMB 8255 / S1) TaxID=269796 RepID=Q2RRD3_RHORT|nr:SDR family oxidoreductase [Rhodospirillum rubrum]ABC23312.1 3-oxoacyl-(acyl-carrier-protein) reductase [Rhodospirillum rubrum ATCC 11170]AEO49045.1 3-oxoacyl-(acyl-carrier-protein) reductase [Rhodospirillum rubrum F11]MBK5954928.1 3-oxoacyl-ACP reductase [Rhodospirillum rubrum]QXG79286.1 SDR family oxidoreductase [Rhodospirillum rubrum]HAP99447.1 SDR family NAD(P)-dependent oxidoreductase [Rhodospirillum rubrum]
MNTVIITGASRGIGHATAVRFLNEGWRVITCARADVPPECKRDKNWTAHFPVDLSDPAAIDVFARQIVEHLNGDPLHALVNNAGVSPKTTFKERLGVLNGSIDRWREVFELNFFAPLRLARAFATPLRKSRGAIVNITSIAGHYVHPFAGSAYSTSKAALSGLTREMAVEFAQLGVRVNAVAPGEIKTEMIAPEYEALIPRIPLDRMGSTEDVASCVYRLCTEEFGYVTGTEIYVTGGQHLL